MICLERIRRTDKRILKDMAVHYSQPKGFVGRNLCYAVLFDGRYYGAIVGGSTPKHLPNRAIFFALAGIEPGLNEICNNIFFHVEGPYPCRNFTTRVLKEYRWRVEIEWFAEYGDTIKLHETLVELPRTGETYKRDRWFEMGQTKGFTCKRTGGQGTDSWTGKRVWDTDNLRPKRYFARKAGL